jgi:hypothetical protein
LTNSNLNQFENKKQTKTHWTGSTHRQPPGSSAPTMRALRRGTAGSATHITRARPAAPSSPSPVPCAIKRCPPPFGADFLLPELQRRRSFFLHLRSPVPSSSAHLPSVFSSPTASVTSPVASCAECRVARPPGSPRAATVPTAMCASAVGRPL